MEARFGLFVDEWGTFVFPQDSLNKNSMNSLRLCVGVSLILTILISITSITGAAAELKPAAASLGDIITSGNVLIGESPAVSGNVMDGDRIRTDIESSAR
jgi:hypothetical protein